MAIIKVCIVCKAKALCSTSILSKRLSACKNAVIARLLCAGKEMAAKGRAQKGAVCCKRAALVLKSHCH